MFILRSCVGQLFFHIACETSQEVDYLFVFGILSVKRHGCLKRQSVIDAQPQCCFCSRRDCVLSATNVENVIM